MPYFHTWCGLSANLGCRSETWCTRLAENTGRKKIAKKSQSAHHRTTLSGYIFATKAHIDNRKENLLSSIISSRCPHNMVNFGLLAAEIRPVVWGTPANFNGFRVLASLLLRCRLTGANQTVQDAWPSPGCYTIIMYIYGSSCPVTEFCQVQSSLCVHLRTVAQFPRAISSLLRHVWTIGKKLTKQKYILHMFSQYGEFRPTSGWDLLASLRHHSKFQRVSRFGSVSAATSLTWG